MKQQPDLDISQLLTAAEAGRAKGMDRELVRYHLARPGAPEPVLVGVYKHPFYRVTDVEAWTPNSNSTKGRKTK